MACGFFFFFPFRGEGLRILLFNAVFWIVIYDLIVIFFKRAGFWSAMASNLTNQSRNVLSKKVMVKNEVIYAYTLLVGLNILIFPLN